MPHVVAGVSESIRPGQPPAESRSLPVGVRIPIETEADVSLAEEQGRHLAWQLDFSPADITVIATAIVEVARNVLQYAKRGELLLNLTHRSDRLGITIIARDKGPGISDLEQAVRDGHGLGLATTRRLMDEFRVRSERGRGTTVTMRKWTRRRRIERAGSREIR